MAAVVEAEGSIGVGFNMSPRRVSHVEMSIILRDNAYTEQKTCVPSTLTNGGRREIGGGDERNHRQNRAVP